MNQQRIANRRLSRIGPMGTVASLLTASMVVTVGLIARLNPETILVRTLVSSLLIGAVVTFGASVIKAANTSRASG